MEKISCNICGSWNHELILKDLKDINFGIEGQFNIVRCIRCDLAFLNPRPSENKIHKYYTDKYRDGQGILFQNPSNLSLSVRFRSIKRKLLSKIFLGLEHQENKFNMIRRSIAKILHLWPRISAELDETGLSILPSFKNRAKVLEVGFGGGLWLQNARDYGWNVAGVELNKEIVKKAKTLGYRVYSGKFTDIDFGDQKFELIYMNHVLEHTFSPKETLLKCNSLLTEKGWLYIRIPNFNSIAQIVFGPIHYQLDVPRHLFFFTESSIKKILSVTEFNIIKIRYISKPLPWIKSMAQLDDLKQFANELKLYQTEWFNHFKIITQKINNYGLGDDLVVLCKKK